MSLAAYRAALDAAQAIEARDRIWMIQSLVAARPQTKEAAAKSREHIADLERTYRSLLHIEAATARGDADTMPSEQFWSLARSGVFRTMPREKWLQTAVGQRRAKAKSRAKSSGAKTVRRKHGRI